MQLMNKVQSYLLTQKIAKLQRQLNYFSYRKIDNKVDKINNQIKDISEKLNILHQKDIDVKHEKLNIYKTILNENPNHELASQMALELNLEADFENFRDDDKAQLMISNLTMRFGGLKAVDNLSLTVNSGEIYGLIGPNGAGKTTVFNCITQFYRPKEGRIYFKDLQGTPRILNNYQTHDIINLGLSRTFQNVELVWELNVLDNMLVGAHALYSSGFFTQLFHLPKLKIEEAMFKAKAESIIKMLGIEAYTYAMPYGLPYGVLKKIELARTLMTDPKLIILDEPAAGLNDSETVELANTIKEIRKQFNLTIILVEHDMGLVMDVCDRICAISFGKKIAVGTPEAIQNNKEVQVAYLGGQ